MINFKKDDLKPLLDHRGYPSISIYLPMARSSDQTQKNPIRYKNAIKSVEKHMEQAGSDVRQVRSIVAQLEEAVDGFEEFQNQLDGLAVFLADDFLKIIKLPVSFEERVEVHNSFEIRPLLQALQDDKEFYLLALSKENARLFRASKFNIAELKLGEDIPTSFREAMRYDAPQDQLQHQAITGADGGSTAIFHGHTESDQSKKHLRRYFQMLDHGVGDAITEHDLPIVIAGLDYLQPVYREVTKLAQIMEEGIRKNPDNIEIDQLHELAWQLVKRDSDASINEAVNEFNDLTGTERGVSNMENIPLAAVNGRVDTLFVGKNGHLWGEVDLERQEVAIKGQDEEFEETELLDFSIKHTIQNGGDVFVLDEDEMPVEDSPAGVILRY